MRLRQQVLAVCFPFALLSADAYAAHSFCQNFGLGGIGAPLGSFQCADTEVGAGNGAPLVLSPDQAAAATVSAAQSAAGSGVFASFSSASSTASPGLLRAIASADSTAPPPDDGVSFAQAIARADATFVDAGSLVAVGGSLPGAPVTLRVTINVSGSFLNLGEGVSEVQVIRNDVALLVNRTVTVLGQRPTDFQQIDLPGFQVGDKVTLRMALHAEAGATNQGDKLVNRSQKADLGNTGHLYLDVLSGNATFESASGHLYGSDVGNVPEPSTYALFGSGLGMLLWLRRRRQRARQSGP